MTTQAQAVGLRVHDLAPGLIVADGASLLVPFEGLTPALLGEVDEGAERVEVDSSSAVSWRR